MAVINICSLNVTSFMQKDRQIEFGNYLIKNNIDFGLVQESRLKKKKWVEIPKGYNCFRDDTGVGTLILAKNKFKYEIVPTSLNALNATAIQVKGRSFNNTFIVSLYVPCTTIKNHLITDLDSIANISPNSPLIIGGDLNTGTVIQDKFIRNWINSNSQKFNLISPNTPTFRSGNTLDHFILSTDINTKSSCKTYIRTPGNTNRNLTEFSCGQEHRQKKPEMEEGQLGDLH